MMRMALAAFALMVCTGAARADVPVGDAANLDQKSLTQSSTASLVPVTQNRSSSTNCVKKSVTTGQAAPTTNTTAAASQSAGQNIVQGFVGGANLTTPPDASAAVQGQTAAVEQQASGVAGGVAAGQATVSATVPIYSSLTSQIGTTSTLQQSMDVNSGVRLQNALAWNAAINAMTLVSQAWNVANLASDSDLSLASTSVTSGSGAAWVIGQCPPGTTGQGTTASPCVSTNCVPAASQGSACVVAQYTDTFGNVETFLVNTQVAWKATQVAAAAGQSTAGPLTETDFETALRQYVGGQH